MRFYADLHIHSHYSRATSKDLNLENLYVWAQLKGIQVVGTGDCIHPQWLKELEQKLEPAGDGLFQLKSEFAKPMDVHVPAACRGLVRFMLTTEISNIYKRLDRVRKVHNLIWMPSFESARKVQAKLDSIGNIKSDGRPILGLDSRDLLEITLEADSRNIFVPAHIWTPWFSALGSMGGFDRMEDCFADLTKYIYAIETGLSSDPLMNWRLTQLDPFIQISNSDAHSPSKLGREANIFNTELSYAAILNALKDPNDKGLEGTLEFFPEEGKYHYDGHRNCQTRMHPKETIANKGLCSVCGKSVTVGVMARVEELADRPEGIKAPRFRPYKSLIALPSLIGEAKDCGPASKKVNECYKQMLSTMGNEFHILCDASIDQISKCAGDVIGEGIKRMREGKVDIASGYDGEFGTIKIFSDKERINIENQLALF
jgi:DNA helicase II / ATP-dependent DNA helicase PcrA